MKLAGQYVGVQKVGECEYPSTVQCCKVNDQFVAARLDGRVDLRVVLAIVYLLIVIIKRPVLIRLIQCIVTVVITRFSYLYTVKIRI